jgi:hypothetical protein
MTQESPHTSEQSSGTVHKGLWSRETKMASVVAGGGRFFLPVAFVFLTEPHKLYTIRVLVLDERSLEGSRRPGQF